MCGDGCGRQLVGAGTIRQGSPSNAHRLNATRTHGWRKHEGGSCNIFPVGWSVAKSMESGRGKPGEGKSRARLDSGGGWLSD